MRLIDTRTGLFVWVNNPSDVQYAILSHVWVSNEELSYEGLLAIHSTARNHTDPPRYIFDTVPAKVRELCTFARRHGIPYAWLDTCCIDKGSSAELSEAINSMYKWYQMANICIAYLADVDDPHLVVPGSKGQIRLQCLVAGRPGNPIGRDTVFHTQFRGSQWFKRGWTLQELIAPRSVLFVCRTWRPFGTKQSFADVIEEVTGITPAILTHAASVDSVSVAMRMSWASDRVTTREEDRAYSLMGIFGVNLPTIYGEGGFAFVRLQEEILKRVPDETLFIWGRALTQGTEQTRRQRTLGVPSSMQPPRAAAKHFAGLGGRPFHQPSHSPLFAASPAEFQRLSWDPDETAASDQLQVMPHQWLAALLKRPDLPLPEYTHTCYGVRARLPLMWWRADIATSKTPVKFAMALLGCVDSKGRVMALLLGPQDSVRREFKVGFDDVEGGARTLHRIATIPRQWIESDRSRITVEEIYIHHADGSRSSSPPPILSLVGLAQSTDLQELLLHPVLQERLRMRAAGKIYFSLETRVFHLANSRLHIHVTAGPCSCESGDTLIRVTVGYRWRSQALYVVPRELRPPVGQKGNPDSQLDLCHSPATHVATWTHEAHSSSFTASKEFSIEWVDGVTVIYNLRLTMQACQSGGSFLSLTVVDARDKAKKDEFMQTEDFFKELDMETSDLRLAQEVKKEVAELMEYPERVCILLADGAVFKA
ncbi:Vegetative incompatibility protein HET-E-1 [Trametes pubescens]|uniref:Vegetative incompatibility protein HET-E-1 n=1 Tax=Trametes pubescens TaxID=154538 RepID=A0A1M2VNI9_TRAPU|nr:Vegetative incompatibility protein HET-E-1 [Trametes pubescens]